MQSSLMSRCSRCSAQSRAGSSRSVVARPLNVSRARVVSVAAAFSPPPVSATKSNFLDHFKRPIPSIYNVVLQELLVQQHFTRYSVNYSYNAISALGLVSVFDQVLETMEEKERAEIFNAYVRAVAEDPEQYRRDAAALEKAAAEVSGKLSADGDSEMARTLASTAAQAAAGKLAYSKFFAVGLFRLLEITGAKEPSALEDLVKTVGVKPDAVNRDLSLYRNNLAKLAAAKELMRDFLEREKKKQAEREAEKKAKAEKEAATSTA